MKLFLLAYRPQVVTELYSYQYSLILITITTTSALLPLAYPLAPHPHPALALCPASGTGARFSCTTVLLPVVATTNTWTHYFLYLIFFTLHPRVASTGIRPLMGTPEGYNLNTIVLCQCGTGPNSISQALPHRRCQVSDSSDDNSTASHCRERSPTVSLTGWESSKYSQCQQCQYVFCKRRKTQPQAESVSACGAANFPGVAPFLTFQEVLH